MVPLLPKFGKLVAIVLVGALVPAARAHSVAKARSDAPTLLPFNLPPSVPLTLLEPADDPRDLLAGTDGAPVTRTLEGLSSWATEVGLQDDEILSTLLLHGASPEGVFRELQQLPPGPGSTSLALTAFLCLGVWHVGRAARHLDWGSVPEWYHPGGPAQIGRATPFDINATSLPLCNLLPPDGGFNRHSFLAYIGRAFLPCPQLRWSLNATAPRGPPPATILA